MTGGTGEEDASVAAYLRIARDIAEAMPAVGGRRGQYERRVRQAVSAVLDAKTTPAIDHAIVGLRKIYMKRERTNFNRICNTIHLRAPSARSSVVELRRRWRVILDTDVESLGHRTERYLDDWFNGLVFHSDRSKYDRISVLLRDEVEGPVLAGVLVGAIMALSEVAVALREVIKDAPELSLGA